jgi:methylmalonyl-CoA/ethylmalonyl-CoA epimerase
MAGLFGAPHGRDLHIRKIIGFCKLLRSVVEISRIHDGNVAMSTSHAEPPAGLPLQLSSIDHYTINVEDGEAAANFHIDVLGFGFVGIQDVNTGAAPEGEHDMRNYILQIPQSPDRVCVITQGLREDSIFTQFLRKYGPGVHHVAYAVDDLEKAVTLLWENKIETTSREILRDPLTGLRQIFIAREHCGYFIELIERTDQAQAGVFANQNMSRLAQTMDGYLKQ